MNEIITNTPSLNSNSISDAVSNNSLSMNNSISESFNFQQLIKYGLVVIILALLGFNLFSHLGNLTDNIKDFLSPITNIIGNKTGKALETTTLNTAQGIKGIGNVTGNIIESGVGLVKHGLDGPKNDTTQISDPLIVDEEPEPDTTDSVIQTTPKTGTGYCYVGEDRGIRSCVKINKNHKCMSGDIFPTRDICINPNLRH
jgi:hypothetical protein